MEYNNPAVRIPLQIVGSISVGIALSSVIPPLDTIRLRIQLKKEEYDGFFDCNQKIANETNRGGLWKSGLYFGRYDPNTTVVK